DRISTKVEDNTYTITVKDLRPDEDEGVYTLKSDHLILDTPSISVTGTNRKEEKPEVVDVVEEIEEEIIVVEPINQQELVDVEVLKIQSGKLTEVSTTTTVTDETVQDASINMETNVTTVEDGPMDLPTVTGKFETQEAVVNIYYPRKFSNY
ncbi:unnamed protein product, partial [Rotaria magnacalcarata]